MTTTTTDTGSGTGPGAAPGAVPGVDVCSLTDDDLTAALLEWETLAARQAVLMAVLVREVDDRDLGRRSGAASTMSWLRDRLRLRPGEAKTRIDLARRLTAGDPADAEGAMDWVAWVSGRPGRGAMPATAAALAEGAVSGDHARVIARVLRRIPACVDDDTVTRAETDLAGFARVHDPAILEKLGDYLVHLVTPESLAGEEDRDVDRRELRLDENTGTIRGHLDREGLAQLRSALDPLAAPCPAADGTPDPRTPARRFADAVVELARQACNTGHLPTARGARPHLSVITDLDTLLTRAGDAGSSVFGTSRDSRHGRDEVAPGEVAWGGPISAETVRRIACDAGISRVITDPAGVPLDVGQEYRTVTPGQFVALVARDGGCAFSGCTRPASWCQAHHIVHWADGGATSLDNQVLLLCAHHHRVIHHHGWTVQLNPDDRLPEFIPPRWVDPDQLPRRNTRPRYHRKRSP